MSTSKPERFTGLLAISLVVLIYAANFVATRFSLLNGLGSHDLAALRYLVAGLIMLPYFIRLGLTDLGGIGWFRAVIITCLAGSPYMLVFFFGLEFAPAAHGAVLNPAIVPSVVFIAMVLLGLQSFSFVRAVSLILIFLGIILVTSSSFSLQGSVLLGDLLLLSTGISWGIFTLLTRLWSLKPLQSTAIISVISLLYLPVYFIFFYEGFSSVTTLHVVSQALFQGLVLSIGTIFLVTYAVQQLGAQLTALFSPLVPILTALLAIPLLGELPGLLQWLGIALVVTGMLSAARIRSV